MRLSRSDLRRSLRVWIPLAVLTLAPGTSVLAADVRFNRDIRPILADHCFQCHGPDASSRKAKLRLDLRDGAIAHRDDGAAVVPGDPKASSLMARVTTSDPDDIMPPPDLKKPLSSAQVELLRQWIQQGAPYEGHWAYQPIERPRIPEVPDPAFAIRNPIDSFILARLRNADLKPSPEADRRTLYRRLSMDLTGLPPAAEDVEAFVTSTDPRAYERAVLASLDSPHFGERMAVFWLDLVRYADTVGYHGDQDYTLWPYRDYVIRAFNANMPFSAFTLENLAGDLLANPSHDQRIASGYNRLLMITAEGGAQDREYRAKYAADRVRNASTVWMGVTLGCAECHDHKYDPFTARDFYGFSAFFADLNEKGFYDRGYPAGNWGPSMQLPTPAQSAAQSRLKSRIAQLEAALKSDTPELIAAQSAWEQAVVSAKSPQFGPWQVLGPFTAANFDEAYRKDFGPERGVDLTQVFEDGKRTWQAQPDWKDGEVHELTGLNAATYVFRTIHVPEAQPLQVSLGSDDAIKVWLNGESVLAKRVERGVAPDQEKPMLKLKAGENQLLLKIVNGAAGYAFYFKALGMAPDDLVRIARQPAATRKAEDHAKLTDYFRGQTPLLDPTRAALAEARKESAALETSITTTLVSEALPEPRPTRVLRRGNWLDDGGELVQPAVPHFLPQPKAADRRLTRRDLAEWLVANDNPLTARVFVNRLWKQFFGTGLSRKLEDIGAQGEWPSHPELLDWLASEFQNSGWNVKHMVRLMTLSSAYRQSSVADDRRRAADPDNRLLARQSAVRLDAEFVRDGALAVSGLLVDAFGGPSVRPYQPAGYYSQLNFPKREYQPDHNANQYRRGLYTHWQRTFLHPSLAAFDAPTREECTAERVRSNTPQQALVLLNDPTYVEAARAFAERILRDGGATPETRIRFAFRAALAREPNPEETRVLLELQGRHASEYAADPAAAAELLSVGDRPAPGDLRPADLASWTSVARAILNLHEIITRS